MYKVYLSIGTNIGNKEENIKRALKLLSDFFIVNQISSIYLTEPWGFYSEHFFYNIAVQGYYNGTPKNLIKNIKSIEKIMNRKYFYYGQRYSDRIIDIDIIYFDNFVYYDFDLIIPHKEMHNRKFVLMPLSELKCDIIHPILFKNINELISICKDETKVNYLNLYVI